MQRTRKGFTLIELLIVVVIIGILAAVAIPKFSDTKKKAYITAMKSDLKNITSSAEAYFADNNTYVGMPDPVGSKDVTITFTGAVDGWSATATHSTLTNGEECEIGVGSAKPADLAEGEPGGATCK
ncbi:MAG: type IV pilin protein [Gemmatimonas sp.]|jgi:prepilin-type N-terminal cleavage/methylation domain-containing protein|uniref:type IV pilin protein n=1 Tax=Gemmatimonas sp. TaxID=1962908 RepID=UPI00391F8CB8